MYSTSEPRFRRLVKDVFLWTSQFRTLSPVLQSAITTAESKHWHSSLASFSMVLFWSSSAVPWKKRDSSGLQRGEEKLWQEKSSPGSGQGHQKHEVILTLLTGDWHRNLLDRMWRLWAFSGQLVSFCTSLHKEYRVGSMPLWNGKHGYCISQLDDSAVLVYLAAPSEWKVFNQVFKIPYLKINFLLSHILVPYLSLPNFTI